MRVYYTPPAPVASVNDVSMNEGNTGTQNMKFTVTLTGDLSQARTVGYVTADGTATAFGGGAGNPDYTHKSGVLNFAPNQSTATVNVPIRGDISGHRSLFDSSKAGRLLGWFHADV